MSRKIELGEMYTDKIDGFSGTAVARSEFLNGCKQVLLKAKVKNGKPGEESWVDEDQLEGVEPTTKSGGGFRSHPETPEDLL